MAPKRAAPPASGTRRSTRIASKAGSSRASSVAPEEEQPTTQSQITQTQTTQTRYSTRLASKAGSSRASSVAPEEEKRSAKEGICKQSTKKKAAFKKTLSFDAIAAIERIVDGDRAYIRKLTNMQKEAVINAFADREVERNIRFEQHEAGIKAERADMKTERAEMMTREALIRDREARLKERIEHLERLEAENEELRRRAASAPNKLRDTFLAQRIVHLQREQSASQTPEPTKPSKIASRVATPAAKTDLSEQTFTDFTQSSLIESTPAFVQAPPAKTPESETPQRRSFFGSLFRTFTTPFSSRKSATPTSTPAPQIEQPKLGELPASRKRPAPQPEPEVVPQPEPVQEPQRPQSQPEHITNSETPRRAQVPPQATIDTFPQNRTIERSLATITEYTEPSEQAITMPEPTPSRQPRRIRDTIRRSTAASATPKRAWTSQPAPREPNADRRMEKLRKFKELDEQLKAMKNDPETKDIIERPMKRVKIDELVAIPHNRPGDAPSTFRMFDVNSDDEMEVDEELELRPNIFDASEEKTSPKPPQILQSASDPMPAVEKEAQVNYPQVKYNWPDVGPRKEPLLTGAAADTAAARFDYAFKLWKSTGELYKW